MHPSGKALAGATLDMDTQATLWPAHSRLGPPLGSPLPAPQSREAAFHGMVTPRPLLGDSHQAPSLTCQFPHQSSLRRGRCVAEVLEVAET